MKKVKRIYPYRTLRSGSRPANGPVPTGKMKGLQAIEIPYRQPARYPFARIYNLLGDFSEQTGAAFG